VHTGGGALDHLGDLGIGDRIVVTTTHGPIAYAVESVTYYPKQTLAESAAATFSQTGPPRLVLITCERWNGTSYDGNTVVVARPVAS
jgi:sortase (surface protein transpeptidase)